MTCTRDVNVTTHAFLFGCISLSLALARFALTQIQPTAKRTHKKYHTNTKTTKSGIERDKWAVCQNALPYNIGYVGNGLPNRMLTIQNHLSVSKLWLARLIMKCHRIIE